MRFCDALICRLRGESWLCDQLVDTYIRLLRERNKEYKRDGVRNDSQQLYPRVVFASYNILTYVKMANKGDFDPLRTCLSMQLQKLILNERDGLGGQNTPDGIAFILNERESHWICLYYDVRRRRIIYLDSLYRVSSSDIWTKPISRVLGEELSDSGSEVDVTRWPVVVNKLSPFVLTTFKGKLRSTSSVNDIWLALPRQRNGGSCGVYALCYLECIARGDVTYFTDDDVPLLRKKMALHLYKGLLPK